MIYIQTKILESVKRKNAFENKKIYTIQKITLPASMYKYILEKGKLKGGQNFEYNITMSIALTTLKNHSSKKVKRFCATYLMKDFFHFEVTYYYDPKNTSVTVYRKLIGTNTQLTI